MSCSGPPTRSDAICSSLQPSRRSDRLGEHGHAGRVARVCTDHAPRSPRLSIDSIATKAQFQGSRLRIPLSGERRFQRQIPVAGPTRAERPRRGSPKPVLDRPQEPVVRHRRRERSSPAGRAGPSASAGTSDRTESDSSKMTKTALLASWRLRSSGGRKRAQPRVAGRDGTVVHVVAHVRHDEREVGQALGCQVARERRQRHDVPQPRGPGRTRRK